MHALNFSFFLFCDLNWMFSVHTCLFVVWNEAVQVAEHTLGCLTCQELQIPRGYSGRDRRHQECSGPDSFLPSAV